MKRDNSKYTHGRTCVYKINYHIICGTKYRNKWTTPEIDSEIKQVLCNIAKENGFTIERVEIWLDDHVHLLISAPPKLSVTVIVKCLKGTSSFRLFRLHPELKQFYWKLNGCYIWSPSYFVEIIGTTNYDAIAKYIDDQKRNEEHYEQSKQSN